MKQKHECPYLKDGKYCTHRRNSNRRTKNSRNIDCIYSKPSKCKYYNKSLSLAKKPLKSSEKPLKRLMD